MKGKAFYVIICAVSTASFLCNMARASAQEQAPPVLTWRTLAEVSFEHRWDKNAQMEVSVPHFQTPILKMDGQEVAISGYVIPVDVEMGYYVISAYPFAACFFCGGAGPESVVDLHFREKKHFKTDERLTICGTFSLNRTDLYQLPYQLLNAYTCQESGK